MKKRFYFSTLETRAPLKEHKFDAGYDLFLPEPVILKPFETKTIDLKIRVNLAETECGIICMRSRFAKEGLIAHTSPIDYGYTGTIHLIVTNCSGQIKGFQLGDSICQLVIFNIPVENNKEFYNDLERS